MTPHERAVRALIVAGIAVPNNHCCKQLLAAIEHEIVEAETAEFARREAEIRRIERGRE